MEFGSILLGKPSHDAIVKLHDYDLKLLEAIKRTITARAKCDRDYANALSQVSIQCSKMDPPSYDSPMYKAWQQISRGISEIVQNTRRGAEVLQSTTLEKVVGLIKEKLSTKKYYAENRERIDNELIKVIHTDLDKKHGLYTKLEKEVAAAHKYYDECIEKGKQMEKAQEKYKKTTMKLHNYHNDYVLQVAEAQMHQKHYRNSILPEFLDGVDFLQRQYIDAVQNILLEYLQYTSPCREELVSSQKLAEDSVKAVDSNFEYKKFAASFRTPLEGEACIEFSALQGEGYALPHNHILLNSLSLQRIDHLARSYHDDLEIIQGQINEHQQRLNDLDQDIQHSAQNIDRTIILTKQHEYIDTKLCLIERQHIQDKQQQLHYLLNQTLKELGDEDPPVGLYLPELDSLSSPGSTELRSPLDKILPGAGGKFTFPWKNIKDFVTSKSAKEVREKEPPLFDLSKSAQEQRWFHGALPRLEVAQLLVNDGDFLLRDSTTPGELALSARSDGQIRHFKLQKSHDGTYRFDSESRNSVGELIYLHYENRIPVTRKTNCLLITPICKDKWQLTHDDVYVDESDKLGSGNFGTVYRGVLARTKELVAVKTCKETVDRATREKFLMEARILKEFDHPNIVKLIGVCMDKQPVYIVMELVAGGDLGEYLKKQQNQLVTYHLVQFCRDACAGLAYLEEKKCIHRDVATRNCLVGDSCVVKITDFGMSREEEDGIYTMSGSMKSIPIKWTAPEAINEGRYTSASDVWSFGILSWEIFAFGQQPYPNMTNRDVREMVAQGRHMNQQMNCPNRYYDEIMEPSWDMVPERRPRFAQLLPGIESILRTL